MDHIHAWLYDHYCAPILQRMWDFPDRCGLRPAVEQAALLVQGGGTDIDRRDALEGIRLSWGTEAFSLGLSLGLEIALGGQQEELLD